MSRRLPVAAESGVSAASVQGGMRTYTSSAWLWLSGNAAASTVNPSGPPTRHGNGPGPSSGRAAEGRG